MSIPASLNTAFALALVAQAENVGFSRPVAPTGDTPASRLDTANLRATLDPTRAAFASALLSIDVANAPEAAGPYSPSAASGPLTEDDIFDPSKLYSLPGQELVVIEGTAEAGAAAIANWVQPTLNSVSPQGTSQGWTTNLGAAASDGKAGNSGGAPPQSSVAPMSGSRLPADLGAATIPEVRPSTLTLELVVADYMSLRQAGLAPHKRKILRGLKSRFASFFEAGSWLDADTPADGPQEHRQT